MARYPAMINTVIDLLGEGKTTNEITEETGCSKSTVTVARKRLKERDGDITEATGDINADVDENVDNFIKSIKITPPEKTEDTTDPVDEDEDYVCPNCSHTWAAPKTERQDSCPQCGTEFN
jgi:rubrerythrin